LRGIGPSKQSIIPRRYNAPVFGKMKKTNITNPSREGGNYHE
jgi:hypothetical protein